MLKTVGDVRGYLGGLNDGPFGQLSVSHAGKNEFSAQVVILLEQIVSDNGVDSEVEVPDEVSLSDKALKQLVLLQSIEEELLYI